MNFNILKVYFSMLEHDFSEEWVYIEAKTRSIQFTYFIIEIGYWSMKKWPFDNQMILALVSLQHQHKARTNGCWLPGTDLTNAFVASKHVNIVRTYGVNRITMEPTFFESLVAHNVQLVSKHCLLKQDNAGHVNSKASSEKSVEERNKATEQNKQRTHNMLKCCWVWSGSITERARSNQRIGLHSPNWQFSRMQRCCVTIFHLLKLLK